MKNKISTGQGDEARFLALKIIYQVTEKGAYANLILEKQLSGSNLSSKDRHLVTELVNGTIRMLKHLDWVLNLFMNKPISSQNPWLRNILRVAVYQMLFLDTVPDYAAINGAVEMTRAKIGPGLAGLTNGILRNISRQRDNLAYPDQDNLITFYSVYYSQPDWLVRQLLSEYDVGEVRRILEYYNQRPRVVLRTNTLKMNRDQLIEKLSQEGIFAHASSFTPYGVILDTVEQSLMNSAAYRDGLFYVQNEASMLAVSILDPQPEEYILDLCAGVGGKTGLAAQLMANRGRIDAYDIHKHKIDLLKSNCERLGITIVSAYRRDILSLSSDHIQAEGVLLDAPCSGLGVLNRRADSRWRKSPEDIDALASLQAQMLAKAAQLVRPGGRLVYCTCTINKDENENIIMAFLNKNPGYLLESFSEKIGYAQLDVQDSLDSSNGMLTIIPGKYQTDGMFYAKMRRISNI